MTNLMTEKLVRARKPTQLDCIKEGLDNAGVKYTLIPGRVGTYLVFSYVEPDEFLYNKDYYKYLVFNSAEQFISF